MRLGLCLTQSASALVGAVDEIFRTYDVVGGGLISEYERAA
jgi:hypothetical protein